MKKLAYAGVRKTEDSFEIDYDIEYSDDIISMMSPQIYKSSHYGNVYYFGYKFNDTAHSPIRNAFVNYIKGVGDNIISQKELVDFISRPLIALHNHINLMTIDGCVYPKSTGNVIKTMLHTIGDYTSHNVKYASYELVKSAPIDIQFDWEKFNAHYEDTYAYPQMKQYIETQLMPKIHDLDYFSLSREVKHKYRPYIMNYLGFPDLSSLEKFEKLKRNRILIIDDVNSSGSTLNEIMRVLLAVNADCKIYIFTLIGK